MDWAGFIAAALAGAMIGLILGIPFGMSPSWEVAAFGALFGIVIRVVRGPQRFLNWLADFVWWW